MDLDHVKASDLKKVLIQVSTAQCSVFVKRFNETLEEFLKKLEHVFPDYQVEIVSKLNEFHMARSTVGEKAPLVELYKVCRDYSKHIETCNEEFFLKEAKSIDFCGINFATEWNKTAKDTQVAIWQYVQLLWRLASQYVQARQIMLQSDEEFEAALEHFKKRLKDFGSMPQTQSDILKFFKTLEPPQ